jgi:hypothetical protein
MNKRDLVAKGMVLGPLTLIMAGTGGKSVFAEEKTDWRDELLSVNHCHQIYYKSIDDVTKSLYIFDRGEGEFTVNHLVIGWKEQEDGNFTSVRYTDEETKFDTLKEAYHYAKELKQKHYT